MVIVIDTDMLWYPELLDLLADQEVVVPAVVFLERARQLRKRGQDPFRLLENMERMGWRIEAYDLEQSLASAFMAPENDREWSKRARDVMIAGHVKKSDELWTRNIKDFTALGLTEDQVIDPMHGDLGRSLR